MPDEKTAKERTWVTNGYLELLPGSGFSRGHAKALKKHLMQMTKAPRYWPLRHGKKWTCTDVAMSRRAILVAFETDAPADYEILDEIEQDLIGDNGFEGLIADFSRSTHAPKSMGEALYEVDLLDEDRADSAKPLKRIGADVSWNVGMDAKGANVQQTEEGNMSKVSSDEMEILSTLIESGQKDAARQLAHGLAERGDTIVADGDEEEVAEPVEAEVKEAALDIPPSLPRELQKASPAQLRKAVDYLAKKATRELRKMQDIVQKQIPTAFKKQDDVALGNLQMMERLLAEAVDKREFGASTKEAGYKKQRLSPAEAKVMKRTLRDRRRDRKNRKLIDMQHKKLGLEFGQTVYFQDEPYLMYDLDAEASAPRGVLAVLVAPDFSHLVRYVKIPAISTEAPGGGYDPETDEYAHWASSDEDNVVKIEGLLKEGKVDEAIELLSADAEPKEATSKTGSYKSLKLHGEIHDLQTRLQDRMSKEILRVPLPDETVILDYPDGKFDRQMKKALDLLKALEKAYDAYSRYNPDYK